MLKQPARNAEKRPAINISERKLWQDENPQHALAWLLGLPRAGYVRDARGRSGPHELP